MLRGASPGAGAGAGGLRKRGQSAPRQDPQLAVDAACVGAHRLDANLKGEGDLRIGTTLPQQKQHIALARRQTGISVLRGAGVGDVTRHKLQAARRDVDRVSHVARLRARCEACTGAEGDQLGGLGARQALAEHHQARVRMRKTKLAQLTEIAQRTGVEDQHARAVLPQQDAGHPWDRRTWRRLVHRRDALPE